MLNTCQAGHQSHESKLLETDYGPYWIWDWPRYMDFPNYCTGQDEVSKSIDVNGYWERADTDWVLDILEPGLVLDFGSHIGWFAALATRKGCQVVAVDADPQNMTLLRKNFDLIKRGELRTWTGWVADIKGAVPTAPIKLLKADVEGHEREVIDLTRHLWRNKMIDYALIEVSPIFENRENIMAPSYADLVDELIDYGYRATVHKDDGPWDITGADCTFPQENVRFERL